jgi:hypothetical protein
MNILPFFDEWFDGKKIKNPLFPGIKILIQ